jgi:hypothetical protein
MANIVINKAEYSDVPRVDIPNTDGTISSFYETKGTLEIASNGDYDVQTKVNVVVNIADGSDVKY